MCNDVLFLNLSFFYPKYVIVLFLVYSDFIQWVTEMEFCVLAAKY
jgi:hypothetical protein